VEGWSGPELSCGRGRVGGAARLARIDRGWRRGVWGWWWYACGRLGFY